MDLNQFLTNFISGIKLYTKDGLIHSFELFTSDENKKQKEKIILNIKKWGKWLHHIPFKKEIPVSEFSNLEIKTFVPERYIFCILRNLGTNAQFDELLSQVRSLPSRIGQIININYFIKKNEFTQMIANNYVEYANTSSSRREIFINKPFSFFLNNENQFILNKNDLIFIDDYDFLVNRVDDRLYKVSQIGNLYDFHKNKEYNYSISDSEFTNIRNYLIVENPGERKVYKVLNNYFLISHELEDGRNQWKPNTNYLVNQFIRYNGNVYRCIEEHVSTETFVENKFQQILTPSEGQILNENEYFLIDDEKVYVINQGVENYEFSFADFQTKSTFVTYCRRTYLEEIPKITDLLYLSPNQIAYAYSLKTKEYVLIKNISNESILIPLIFVLNTFINRYYNVSPSNRKINILSLRSGTHLIEEDLIPGVQKINRRVILKTPDNKFYFSMEPYSKDIYYRIKSVNSQGKDYLRFVEYTYSSVPLTEEYINTIKQKQILFEELQTEAENFLNSGGIPTF